MSHVSHLGGRGVVAWQLVLSSLTDVPAQPEGSPKRRLRFLDFHLLSDLTHHLVTPWLF